MRKNVKKQLALRVLSTAALMAMVSSVATAAFAGTYYLEDGDITVNVKDDGHYVTQGESYNNTRDKDNQVNITSRDKETQEVKTTQNVVTVTVEDNATANVTIEDAKIESKGAKDGSEYKNGITVETKGENAKANITLDNVNVETRKNPEGTKDTDEEGGAAMSVKGNGSTTVELDGNNTLTSGSTHAGLEKNDSDCSGSLTITDQTGDRGSLTATGGQFAAGIGSGGSTTDGEHENVSDITIDGAAEIHAEGGFAGAGIGAGRGGDASDLTITGDSKVYAHGSGDEANGSGAGIGSGGGRKDFGLTHNADKITINGNATVEAKSDTAAGIGSGNGGNATNINIAGNATVTAKGYTGIGSGGRLYVGMGTGFPDGDDVSITIGTKGKTREEEHVTVTAIGEATGIGKGGTFSSKAHTTDITIQGGATIKEASGIVGIGSGYANGRDTAIDKVNIMIRDNVLIEKVSGTAGMWRDDCVAIGSGVGAKSNITIDGTGGHVELKNVSSEGSAQKGGALIGVGTVVYDPDSEEEATVSNVTIRGNVDINLNQKKADQPFIWVGTSEKGNEQRTEKSADELMDTIGDDAHIFYNRADGSVYQIVHGKNVCIPDEKGFIVDQEPTCTEEGYGHFTCGYEAAKDAKHTSCTRDHSRVAIDPLGHDLKDDWYVVTPATTTSEGLEQRDCHRDGCTYSETRVIPKLTPEGSGSVEMREVGVIFWDAAAQAAPAALQGKVFSADEQTATAAKAQVESLLADKANWKLAEDVGDLKIHPAADAAGTVYEQAVKASGCQYYVIANVTAQ